MYITSDWRVGIVAEITPYSLVVEGHVNDFKDRILDYTPHHFASVNQYIFTFHSRYEAVIFKVFDVAYSEKSFGKSSTDKSMELLRIKASPFGTLDSKGFRLGVQDFPMAGDYVYACTKDVLEELFATKARGGIRLGGVVGFDDVGAVLEAEVLFSGHTGVFGNTGSGKSTTTRYILNQVAQNYSLGGVFVANSKIIVLDLHGDYQFLNSFSDGVTVITPSEVTLKPSDLELEDWCSVLLPSEAMQRPLLERALQYARLSDKSKKYLYGVFAYNALYNSNNDSHASRKLQLSKFLNLLGDDIKVKFRPYDVNGDSVEVDNISDFIRDCFVLVYGNIPRDVFEDLEQALKDYLKEYMEDGVPSVREVLSKAKDEYFTSLSDLDDALELVFCEEESLGNKQARHYSQGLVTRIKNLVLRHDGRLFNNDQDSVLSKIGESDGLVILDMQDIADDDGLSLVANCIARKVLASQEAEFKEYQKGLRSGEGNERSLAPIVLVLDEAHRYMKSEKDASDSIFDRIAREGRKFGTYLFFISQIPSELSRIVLGQASAFLLHRIQNAYDLEYLRRNLPGVSDGEVARLPVFSSGQALVTGSAVNTPMEIIIPGDFKDFTPSIPITLQ